jgi:nanoRNase/pAp phosphatase (c-di-AMP/oligoRNAs hydrolase)
MDLIQSIINNISQASSVLIVTSGSSGDSLAAGLALHTFLKKLEKDSRLLSFTEVSPRFGFLPGVIDVTSRIDLTKSFVIDVATKRVQLEELSYKKEPQQLSIFLKPTGGEFAAGDITFRSSTFPFDLLILVGVANLEQLGEFYNQNSSLFFETPILNLDFKAGNENYGQSNLVDLMATSCSEIVLDLINKFESGLIDEAIATQLLAGIISETNSFQHVRTTPQTFLKASQLVGLGARQQDIIGHLYKSKSLGLLKLWGRTLARLKQDANGVLVYSAVNQADLTKTQATDEDAAGIIKEMAAQLNFAKVFLFLKEEMPNQTRCFCTALLPLNLPLLFAPFSPQFISAQAVTFIVPDSAILAEQQIVATLTAALAKM